MLRMSRFDDLKKDAAGVLRMDELDTRSTSAGLGCVVQQPYATRTKNFADTVDVVNPIADLLDASAAFVSFDELTDGGIGLQGSEQLHLCGFGKLFPGTQHCFLNTLFFVDFAMKKAESEHLGVELDGVVEIENRVANMINTNKQIRIFHSFSFSHLSGVRHHFPTRSRGSTNENQAWCMIDGGLVRL